MNAQVSRWAIVHKKRGETPLQALEAWKSAHNELKGVATSYAGRLDPMAEGKLLVLLGDECRKQGEYTKLDKEYEIEIVVDLKTDTGDVLGLANYAGKEATIRRAALRRACVAELGVHERSYPIFSSKTVKGIPLFRYYFENRLDEIQIPTHLERMYHISICSVGSLTKTELQSRITNALAIVPRSDEPSKALGADFRQDEIRARWEEIFTSMPDRSFAMIKLRVVCGSGSYMRTLAERIGESLGTTAFAISINRIRIGRYVALLMTGLWTKSY